jgi:hypothetical protein
VSEKARREGGDVNAVAESLIVAALEWEARDRAEASDMVRRSDQAAADGRERSLGEFIAEQRARYGFDATRPVL